VNQNARSNNKKLVNTVLQLYKLPTIYKIKRFIAVFTRNCHWSVCWSSWIKSTSSRAVFILRLGVRNGAVRW